MRVRGGRSAESDGPSQYWVGFVSGVIAVLVMVGVFRVLSWVAVQDSMQQVVAPVAVALLSDTFSVLDVTGVLLVVLMVVIIINMPRYIR